jgi:hypothetical protein
MLLELEVDQIILSTMILKEYTVFHVQTNINIFPQTFFVEDDAL